MISSFLMKKPRVSGRCCAVSTY